MTAGQVQEILYREPGHTVGMRILHMADRDQGFDRALCGRKRDRPLEPNAQGEMCVVCAELYRRKWGRDWNE